MFSGKKSKTGGVIMWGDCQAGGVSNILCKYGLEN